MSDTLDHSAAHDKGQPRGERLADEGVIIESDQPPPEYHPQRGDSEADLMHLGHVYRAVITAHFPDSATAERALAAIESAGLGEQSQVQRFANTEGSKDNTGLAVGEVAIIINLGEADEAQGERLVAELQGAGATSARYTPSQTIGDPAPD